MQKLNHMKSKFLFPPKYKKLGWILLVPGILIGLPAELLEWQPLILDIDVPALFIDAVWSDSEIQLIGLVDNNVLNEILGLLVITGGLLVAFSEEPDEDELISKMRLDCLVWAIFWNYGILIVSFLFVYEFEFYKVMVFNMFTPLLLFVARFNWLLFKFRKSLKYEE